MRKTPQIYYTKLYNPSKYLTESTWILSLVRKLLILQ